jgi:translation initiation factor IF-2
VVGDTFQAYDTQKLAREAIEKNREQNLRKSDFRKSTGTDDVTHKVLFVVKADTGSSLEAALSEIQKLGNEKVGAKIISSGIGAIGENDVRLANGNTKAVVLGFHTNPDTPARSMAERVGVEIKTFDIIYKMIEWVQEMLETNTPKIKTEESTGVAKVLKIFSKVKDKQVIGCRVESGKVKLGAEVRITRRDAEIGHGKVKELQKQKNKTDEVSEGEFGTLVEAKVEIAAGDKIEK